MRDSLLHRFLDRSSITTVLSKSGFRRFDLTWIRQLGSVSHIIEFQRSRFSGDGTEEFTINLGVAIEEVERIYSGEGFRRTIQESDCFPRFRVGEVLGGFSRGARDIWWQLSETQEYADLADEVKTIVVSTCVPVLDQLRSIDSVFDFITTKAPPRYPHPSTRIATAIIYYLHGEEKMAESVLAALESTATLAKEWLERILQVRERLGKSRRSAN